ncbi:MAG: NAD(P)H-dependent oxidoreductase [Candidatus Delongbacteria bacterium]|nr:NAD(P)H-dependent oxidoreductase [Candidatus Delongbacteria bacterium]
MVVSVILAHPYPYSFNAAIYQRSLQWLETNGHRVYAHDLYRETFDPVLVGEEVLMDGGSHSPVWDYQREILESEGVVFIHPNWWGQPPAILKGYLDRVWRENINYRLDEGKGGMPVGLMQRMGAVVFNTSDTPAEREDNFFGDPLEKIWKKCVFEFSGITRYQRVIFRVMADSTPQERANWLNEVDQCLARLFPTTHHD